MTHKRKTVKFPSNTKFMCSPFRKRTIIQFIAVPIKWLNGHCWFRVRMNLSATTQPGKPLKRFPSFNCNCNEAPPLGLKVVRAFTNPKKSQLLMPSPKMLKSKIHISQVEWGGGGGEGVGSQLLTLSPKMLKSQIHIYANHKNSDNFQIFKMFSLMCFANYFTLSLLYHSASFSLNLLRKVVIGMRWCGRLLWEDNFANIGNFQFFSRWPTKFHCATLLVFFEHVCIVILTIELDRKNRRTGTVLAGTLWYRIKRLQFVANRNLRTVNLIKCRRTEHSRIASNISNL